MGRLTTALHRQCNVITKSCSWQVSAYEKWLDGEVAKQGKLRPEQDPVLKSADVDAKLDDVRKLFNKLKNKKKPKPPPPPPAAANDTANATGGGGVVLRPQCASNPICSFEDENRLMPLPSTAQFIVTRC